MASAVLRLTKFGGRPFFTVHCLFRQTFPTAERCFHLNPACYDVLKIHMPALSPTMVEGTVVKWLKKEGDKLTPGDILCDIQTDKAVVGMENEEEGILAKILQPDNSQNVKIGSLIALMVEEGEDWKNVEIPAGVTATSKTVPAATYTGETSLLAPASVSTHTKCNIGPSVRKLLEEFGLQVEDVAASGPHGHLLKGDVLKIIKSKNIKKIEAEGGPAPDRASPTSTIPHTTTSPLDGDPYTDIPSSNMRLTIAKRLTESKTTIPHSYATIDCNIGSVSKLRKQLIGEGIKISVNDFIIKAAAIALQRVPQINALRQGDTVQRLSTTDISVAVATENGLITPILQNAANLEVNQISLKVKELAQRAREAKLALHEFQGGSFTWGGGHSNCLVAGVITPGTCSPWISNLGMFGITEFSAVINPPQLAILAIGTSRVDIGKDNKPVTKMNVTLSYDCSVVNETEVFQFLEVFSEVMENPSLMVIGSDLSDNQSTSV